MNARYPFLAERARHRCKYCRAPEAIFNFPFEVEHVIPTSHQGTEDDANLALACRACNLFKSDHLTGVDETTGTTVRLFHPRQDQWEDHFQVDLSTASIQGRTPRGWATVACLQMNRPTQVEARRQWMRLGLFP